MHVCKDSMMKTGYFSTNRHMCASIPIGILEQVSVEEQMPTTAHTQPSCYRQGHADMAS